MRVNIETHKLTDAVHMPNGEEKTSFKDKMTHVYLFYMHALRNANFIPNSKSLELINFIIVWRLRETPVWNHLWLTPACDFTALLILYAPTGSEKNTVICSYSRRCVSQRFSCHNQTQASPLRHLTTEE